MPRGFKVADVYAELSLDRDAARDALRGVPAALGPDADRAGRELGKKMTDGLARAVEASSARLTKARREEQKATDAVKLAELRLNEAREKGNQRASTLLALEQKLTQAQLRLSDAQSSTTTSTRKLDEAQRRLTSSMDDVGKDLGPRAQKAGDDAGGKLALGMRMSIIRNSPLIVAAIGGVLAAGAPVALAGATALFAGVGIVAAAQSQKVQSAWLGTWQRVKSGAIADAAVIEPVLVRVADQVGDSFDRMRPRVRDAFTAAAPQIEVFTGGILDLAENALPGLERAVENGMPVTKGLADFLGKTGTGLSDFFDKITDHGPAAGQVFSSLGDVMGELLPILGEFLGQGAELAADVLPLLTGTLGALNAVLDHTGFLLPTVGAGLMGLKVANLVTGGIGSLATKLDGVAKGGGAMAGVAGRVSGGLSGIAGAAGPAAAGVAFVAVAIQQWNELAEKSEDLNLRLGQAMHVGGSQALAAGKLFNQGENIAGWIPDAVENMNFLGHSIGEMIPSAENASAAYDKWVASLGASGAAAAEVGLRTQDLDLQMRNHKAGSEEVETASRALIEAQREQARVSNDLQMATTGVTEAMLAQADAALGLANADLAHRNAIDAAEDSYAAFNEAIAKFGANSEEASDAARDWEADLSRIVATAGQLATETLPANMDANQRLALSQIAQRDALRELAAQYGDKLPPALQQALASLEATTAGYDLAALEAARLAAETDNASGKMDKLGSKEAIPKIKGDSSVFAGVHVETMAKIKQIADQQPTPKAKLDSGLFGSTFGWVMSQIWNLGGQRPTPAVLLADHASGGLDKIANKLAALRDRTVTVTTKEQKGRAAGGPVTSPIFAAVGRKVQGPGGPTDDLVRAMGPGGVDYRLSPGEWIVNAMASRQQGDAAMAMLNAGMATIVPNSAQPKVSGYAGGGGRTVERQLVSQQPGGTQIHIGSVSLVVPGAFNLGTGADRRRLIADIRAGLVELERADS